MPIIALLLLLSLGAHAKTLPASNFKATQDFIQKMVDKHQFDQGELLSIFTSIELPVAEKTTQKKIKKTTKRKRSLRKGHLVDKTNKKTIRLLLPNS